MDTIVAEKEMQADAPMAELKGRLKATWNTGDYGHIATFMEPGALEFLARLTAVPGTRMLDVACGAGQLAIPAARAGVIATGVDISPNWIEQAKARARAEGLNVRFDEGDAEALPYDDAAFDLVVSIFGTMSAPRPDRVAAELLRVCRPGGRIAMANWTPEGHVGQMFKIIGKYAPPSPLMPPPVKWGEDAVVRERLRDGVASLVTTKRMYSMHYPFAPSEVVELFLTCYGPTNRAFAALDDAGRNALRSDLEQLWSKHNQANDGTTQVPAEYLEVVATRA